MPRAFQKQGGEADDIGCIPSDAEKRRLVVSNLIDCIGEFREIDIRNGGTGAFPYPERFSPANANDSHLAAEWWLDNMMEPESWFSPADRYNRVSSTSGSDQSGVVYGYLSRVKMALALWLNMSPQDREFICAGVIDEHVPWRGDRPEVYAEILSQTFEQRANPVAYRQNAIKNLRRAFANIGERKP